MTFDLSGNPAFRSAFPKLSSLLALLFTFLIVFAVETDQCKSISAATQGLYPVAAGSAAAVSYMKDIIFNSCAHSIL